MESTIGCPGPDQPQESAISIIYRHSIIQPFNDDDKLRGTYDWAGPNQDQQAAELRGGSTAFGRAPCQHTLAHATRAPEVRNAHHRDRRKQPGHQPGPAWADRCTSPASKGTHDDPREDVQPVSQLHGPGKGAPFSHHVHGWPAAEQRAVMQRIVRR